LCNVSQALAVTGTPACFTLSGTSDPHSGDRPTTGGEAAPAAGGDNLASDARVVHAGQQMTLPRAASARSGLGISDKQADKPISFFYLFLPVIRPKEIAS
jgi:hypothetical protein